MIDSGSGLTTRPGTQLIFDVTNGSCRVYIPDSEGKKKGKSGLIFSCLGGLLCELQPALHQVFAAAGAELCREDHRCRQKLRGTH